MQSEPHPLDTAMEALKAEVPRISDAIKNFCSVLAAADLVPPAEGEKQKQSPPHKMEHLLHCAKVVLKSINAYEPPSPEAWAETHPQGEEETGTARIEALTAYKASYALATSARRTEGAKVTKLLSRGYLRSTRCWSDSVGAVAADELARLRFPPHTVKAFLDGWARAIEPASATAAAAGESGEDLSELVWAADFSAALRVRRVARDKEVSERRERMESQADEAETLREALAAEGQMAEAADEEEEEERVVELASGEA